jgi:hypothetical protein
MENPAPRALEWGRYLIAFVITAAIFATAFYVSDRLDRARIAEIQATQDAISTDILSTETQFDLLNEVSSCQSLEADQTLPSELNSLASRLASAEQTLGDDNAQVIELKKQYSLLEIRDYLITQQVDQRCGLKPAEVLYFYSNDGTCADCTDAGYALDAMRQTYPDLRVYSFDYNLDLGALKTLIALEKVEPRLPAFVIDNEPSYGFTTLGALEALFPKGALATSTATTTATSTKAK